VERRQREEMVEFWELRREQAQNRQAVNPTMRPRNPPQAVFRVSVVRLKVGLVVVRGFSVYDLLSAAFVRGGESLAREAIYILLRGIT
jgi:hypothetical protein